MGCLGCRASCTLPAVKTGTSGEVLNQAALPQVEVQGKYLYKGLAALLTDCMIGSTPQSGSMISSRYFLRTCRRAESPHSWWADILILVGGKIKQSFKPVSGQQRGKIKRKGHLDNSSNIYYHSTLFPT